MTFWSRALWMTGLCCFAQSVIAQDVDYDPRRPAELRVCDEHREHGRVNEAHTCYQKLDEDTENVLVHAEAAWANGEIRDANDWFRVTVGNDIDTPHAKVRWGRLFLETHQYADALKLFQEVLESDPDDVQAQLGMARVYAERFEGPARSIIDALLKKDEQLIEAQLLLASMDLEAGKLEDADRALKQALSAAEKQKRTPLEVYSLLAALDLLRGDDSAKRWITRTLAYNPHYGSLFETLAHFETIRRRYAQASNWLLRAIEVQPDLWSAHAELGVNLLRTGNVAEARTHLERAYEGDPFSPTTVNTLRLLDSLKDFKIETASAPNLRMQLNNKEADVLRPYVEQLSRDSIATFSRRYSFEPKQAVTVELYPNHDDFAVRTAGLPGIGLLGVTFGHLVAMDSPTGRPPGEFHWGSTLWHEMAHVFTLSVTDHRVPRWLSEGISVFEEWRTGPTPGVAVMPQALLAFHDGKFLPVADLDEGFIRPSYENQVQVSYMQAGLVCLFIEQQWGFDRLVAFLRQFTRDTTTRAALEDTFKIDAKKFDADFNAFVQKRFAGFLADPDAWRKAMQTTNEQADKQQWSDALQSAERAVKLFPEFTADGNAYLVMAKAQDALGRRNEAIQSLQTYRQMGGWHPDALRLLAKWLDEAGRQSDAIQVLQAVNYVDPMDQGNHVLLGERLLSANRADDALREFKVLMALNPLDKSVPNFGIARALREKGDAAGSRQYLLEALETAPHYRPAQNLLLELTGERTR